MTCVAAVGKQNQEFTSGSGSFPGAGDARCRDILALLKQETAEGIDDDSVRLFRTCI